MDFSLNIKGLAVLSTQPPGPISRESLAFLRGFLEGVELSKLDTLYPAKLFNQQAPQPPKARLKSIREELSDIAKRNGRNWRDVRLLWIDPERLASNAEQVMSLEEFRWERDSDNFYTEAELLELYQDEVGASSIDERRRTRNERIRRRQMAMLSWLEHQMPKPPSKHEQLSSWLPLPLCEKLHDVGVETVDDLARFISAAGHTWWRQVPKVGPKRAAAIERWLRGLAVKEGPIALRPSLLRSERRPNEGSIAPLELFVAPGWMSEECSNVKAWLADFSLAASPNTMRVYRRSIERYVLFCAFAASKRGTLFSAETQASFGRFLMRLGRTAPDDWEFSVEQSAWIGPRHAERTTMAWRPFAGPLSPSSQAITREAVSACLAKIICWTTETHAIAKTSLLTDI